MYTVNITLMPLYEVKVASGNPSMVPYNGPGREDVDPGDCRVTFKSEEYFVLHQMLNGQLLGIVTPAGGK
jgi:hypothetical protein